MRSWLTRGIGKILRQRRLEKHFRLREFSQLSSLSVREISRIERGSLDVDLISLDLFAEALSIDLPQLLQHVLSNDDERILCVSVGKEVADRLQCSFREVLDADDIDHAIVLLDCWRVDCLVIPALTIVDLNKLRVKLLNREKFRSIHVCVITDSLVTEPFGVLTVHTIPFRHLRQRVDTILSNMPKGKVCVLRRLRESLKQRREQLAQSRKRLERQRDVMLNQVERLQRLSERKLNPGPYTEKWNERWKSLADRCREIEQFQLSLLKKEKAVATRVRFVEKNVSWLVQQQSTDSGVL